MSRALLHVLIGLVDRNHGPSHLITHKGSKAMDSEQLVERLSGLYHLSEDTQDGLFTKSSVQLEPQTGGSAAAEVGVANSVSTFVAQSSFHNFAVPPFASHWGIVCDFYGQSKGPRADVPRVVIRNLFHLLFDPRTRKITFESVTWKPEWSRHHVKPVGTTTYQYPNVWATGSEILLTFPLIMQATYY